MAPLLQRHSTARSYTARADVAAARQALQVQSAHVQTRLRLCTVETQWRAPGDIRLPRRRAADEDDPGFWDSPAWRGRALWTPPSEWDDPDERLPHVHLHDAAMKRYTELLEERQGSAY